MPSPELKPVESYSLGGLLADVYAAPSDVFEYVKNTPVRAPIWLVPLLLASVTAVVYILLAFSQPGVIRSIQETQDKAFQKKVASGQMTQAQADQTQKIAARFLTPGVLKLFGAGGALGALVAGIFLMAFVLWMAVRFVHRSGVGYMKVVEVCALAAMIDVLQKIIRAILVVWKGNLLATASPTLFLTNPGLSHRTALWLSLLDPIDIWWLAVLSLGLGKVASISYAKAAVWVFGLWCGFRAAGILFTPG